MAPGSAQAAPGDPHQDAEGHLHPSTGISRVIQHPRSGPKQSWDVQAGVHPVLAALQDEVFWHLGTPLLSAAASGHRAGCFSLHLILPLALAA